MRILLTTIGVSLAASPACAATAFFTSGVSVNKNGQVTDYLGQKGLIEERFNTSASGACARTHPTTVVFSSLGSPTGPLATSAGLVRGPVAGRALPPGTTADSIRDGIPITDQSCYLAAPLPTSAMSSGQIAADINWASRASVLYFGFYWGGIAADNTLTLLSRPDDTGMRTPIGIDGLSDPNGVITGGQLLALFNHPATFSTYLSFRFSAFENFGTVVFGAPSTGFEIDNIAFSTNDFLGRPPAQRQQTSAVGPLNFTTGQSPVVAVPQPALVGLFGLAVLPVAIGRGRRRPG